METSFLSDFREEKWEHKYQTVNIYGFDYYKNMVVFSYGELYFMDSRKSIPFFNDPSTNFTKVRIFDQGKQFVMISDNGCAYFYEISFGEEITVKETKELNVVLNDNNWAMDMLYEEFLFIGGNTGQLVVIDLKKKEVIKRFASNQRIMSISGRDNYFLYGGWSREVKRVSLINFSILNEYKFDSEIYSVLSEQNQEFFIGIQKLILHLDKEGNQIYKYTINDNIKTYNILKFNDLFIYTGFINNPYDNCVYFLFTRTLDIQEIQTNRVQWHIQKHENSFMIHTFDKILKYEYILNFLGYQIISKTRISKLENIKFKFL